MIKILQFHKHINMKKTTSSLLRILIFLGGVFSIIDLSAQATEVYYLRRTPPEPWVWAPILNTNISDMEDMCTDEPFSDAYYSTCDPAVVFSPTTLFVFMEGGDDHAIPMSNFLDDNIATIETWVNAGGALFMNAAPNYGGDIDCGFGGLTINYPDYSWDGTAIDPAHPIFNGPFTPVGLTWSGNYFGHSTVSGPGLIPVIDGDFAPVLSEMAYGSGYILIGGMTTTGWHTPAPECFNVRMNMFRYAIEQVSTLLSFSYDLAGDTTFCQYDPDLVPVFVDGAVAGIFSATPAGLAIDSLTGIVDLSASLPGTYVITNVGPTYCSVGTSSITIIIDATPVANAGPDVYVCRGQNVQLDGSGGVTYQWTPPVYLDDPTLEDPTVVAPPTNSYYQMIATSALGCSDTDDVWAYLYPDPVVDAGEDIIMQLGGFSELNATGGISYVWTPDTWLSDPLTGNPTCFAEDTIMYTVTGTDANGCTATDSMWVFVIEENDIVPPTAFTPNGDGMNDTYRPLFVGVGGEVTDFVIFNRWGAELFLSTDPMIGWDGTYKGIEQEIGTYIVHVNGLNQFGEPISKTSTVVLLR